MQILLLTVCLICFGSFTLGQGASSRYNRLIWQRQINIVKENEQRLLDYVAKQKAKKKSDFQNKKINQNNEHKEKATMIDIDATEQLITDMELQEVENSEKVRNFEILSILDILDIFWIIDRVMLVN